MSHIGNQLTVPRGFGSLSASTRYYFVRSDDQKDVVTLAWFERHGTQQRVHLIHLPRGDFEPAVGSSDIVKASRQYVLPPWLIELEGINFDEIESTRPRAKCTYRQSCEQRYAHISDAIERCEEILSSDDPLKELAALAATSSPRQHPHRIQVWFFAYLLHGRNLWALMSTFHLSGRWDRSSEKHGGKKFGRPSLAKGSAYGFPTHSMRPTIEKAYLALCGLGRTLRAIHREALGTHFGCKVLSKGKVIYHPRGGPFPSYGQFRRAVVDKFGLEQVRRTRWGEARMRSESLADAGSFTQPYANLLEALVVDAYYVKERPRDMLTGQPMPPLNVCRGVCATSANRCGVGFSFGKERGQAYREMLFTMAIPKSKLGQVYGVPIEDDDWPSIGVPAAFAVDRGPGAMEKLIDNLQARFPVKLIAPSHSGQSKAIVESTHPRDDHLQGEPTYVISHLTTIEMMRREVLMTKSENHRSNIASRLTPQMVADFERDGLLPTPFHLWNYLDARYRTDAVSMSFEQAVRTFLKPVTFEATRGQLWLHELRYDAAALRSPKVLHVIATGQTVEIKGYTLTMVTRYAWVEINGQLVEVEAQQNLRDDTEQLYQSLAQQDRHAHALAAMNSTQREYADAAVAAVSGEFKAATGKALLGGERRAGRPKQPRVPQRSKPRCTSADQPRERQRDAQHPLA